MVKYGEHLKEKKDELAKVGLTPQAFVDYELLKTLALASPDADKVESFADQPEQKDPDETVVRVCSQPMSDFFREWDNQLNKIQSTMKSLLCEQDKTTNPKFVEGMMACAELNREALRKIVKKYDKNHPDESNTQEDRVKIYDERMEPVLQIMQTDASVSQLRQKSMARLAQCFVPITAVIFLCVTLILCKASKMQVTFVLGLIAGFMTAWGNAANDICNSMGTSVGAGALSLGSAVVLGAIFEVIGCMTMGPFMSKSIVKDIIETDDYQQTPEMYAFGMVCVLFGAGSTTLLATVYGYPISATHGIIGGLIAVGMSAKGVDSVSWSKVGKTVVGWVAAPLAGLLVAMLVYGLIQCLVMRAKNPHQRSRWQQPIWLWFCVAVNALFVFIKGPKDMREENFGKALLYAAAVGCVLVPVMYAAAMVSKWMLKLSEKHIDPDSPSSQRAKMLARRSKSFLGLDDDDDGDCVKEVKSTSSTTSTKIHVKPARVSPEPEPEACTLGTPSEVQDADPPSEVDTDTGTTVQIAAAERNFLPLLVVSALSVACAHGGNDVGNAVGPLSAIIMVNNDGEVASKPDIPLWALVYGSLGFVIGIMTMGRLTIKTVGKKITVLSPSKSFATQMGAAIAVLGSSALGLPVSTSHCLVGSVVGIGMVDKCMKTGDMNLGMLKKIVIAWAVTIPLASAVAAICFLPFKSIFE